MNVAFETTWLAPGGPQAADKVRFNARQVVDEAQFFRAAIASYFPRGNVECVLEFVVHQIFSTTQLAEQFVLSMGTFNMTNADNGVLQCVIGAESPNPLTIYSPSAVLEDAEVLEYEGRSVDVRYRLRCQPFQTSVPPNTPTFPPSDTSMYVIQRGSQAIASGQGTVAIVFSASFASVPIVTGVMTGQSGSVALFGRVLKNTVTVNGFTAEFSALTPDNSYTFDWHAIQ